MNKQTNEQKNKKDRKMNSKRIVALIGVILLLSLYVVTLLVAIFDRSESGKWFMTCLIASVFLPLSDLGLYLALWGDYQPAYHRLLRFGSPGGGEQLTAPPAGFPFPMG